MDFVNNKQNRKSISGKSDWIEINDTFFTKINLVFQLIDELQEEWQMSGPQQTFHAMKDAILALILGVNQLNRNKHGYDIKGLIKKELIEQTLIEQEVEAKHYSISPTSKPQAIFNDTTYKKINEYEKSNALLVLAIWNGFKIVKICYLPLANPDLISFLKNKLDNKPKNSRSTQTVTLKQMIKWGGKTIDIY
jgi:hypothetical protein